MSFTSNYSNEKTILIVCQFQKNALLYQKKKIRKNFWKKKGYKAALKAFSLADSILTGTSKSYRIVINTKPRPFLPRNQKKSCVIVRNTNVGRE